MPRVIAPLVLSPDERSELQRWLVALGTPQQVALRCRIVLAVAAGQTEIAIADDNGVNRKTVRLWRERFRSGGVQALWEIAPGRGRKPSYNATGIKAVIDATLQTKPKGSTHWSCRTMATAQGISKSSVNSGHERVFSFGEDGWDWRKELAEPGARSMTHLARFVNSFSEGNLLERVPGQSLNDGEAGKADRLTSDRITAMRTNRGNLAMFYSASGRPIRVRMDRLSGKPMNVWWFNPRNGCWSAGGTETPEQRVHSRGVRSGPGAPIHEFTPPGEAGHGRDWALVLSTGDGL